MTDDVKCEKCDKVTPHIVEYTWWENENKGYKTNGYCRICGYRPFPWYTKNKPR